MDNNPIYRYRSELKTILIKLVKIINNYPYNEVLLLLLLLLVVLLLLGLF